MIDALCPMSKMYGRNRSDPTNFQYIPEVGFPNRFRSSSRSFLDLGSMFGYRFHIRQSSVSDRPSNLIDLEVNMLLYSDRYHNDSLQPIHRRIVIKSSGKFYLGHFVIFGGYILISQRFRSDTMQFPWSSYGIFAFSVFFPIPESCQTLTVLIRLNSGGKLLLSSMYIPGRFRRNPLWKHRPETLQKRYNKIRIRSSGQINQSDTYYLLKSKKLIVKHPCSR